MAFYNKYLFKLSQSEFWILFYMPLQESHYCICMFGYDGEVVREIASNPVVDDFLDARLPQPSA